MFRQTLKSNRDVAGELEQLARRASDLSPTDERVREAVVRQNADLSFDPSHPASILEVDGGRGRIGSLSSSYARLLDVDLDEVAEIERDWIVEGT